MPVKPTPPRGLPSEAAVFDSHGARELELFIENDASLYRQQHQPIQRNMLRKMRAGKYNPDLAVKGFMHLADEGARRYNQQFGPGATMRGFDKPTRTAVARSLARSFEAEARLGNMDYLLTEYVAESTGKYVGAWDRSPGETAYVRRDTRGLMPGFGTTRDIRYAARFNSEKEALGALNDLWGRNIIPGGRARNTRAERLMRFKRR